MCFIFAMAISVMAQTKTITNADLEKYRQARLTAEREYRENYERLGMPSPAELDRRNEQSRIEVERLSEKLRTAELERERLDAARTDFSGTSISIMQEPAPNLRYWPTTYWSYASRYHSPRLPNANKNLGYVGGGTFWPTGNRTPSQPVFKRPRR
jgi:hypothetical protein